MTAAHEGPQSHPIAVRKQEPLVVPPDKHKVDSALATYPPPPGEESTNTSTQPSIDLAEQDGRVEALLVTCSETDAKGKPTSRPVASRSFFFQTVFVSIVAFPQLLAEAHIGMLIVPLLDIGRQVNTEDEHQLSWFPAAYGLTVGVFLIVSGRMGDIYGAKLLWVCGMALCVISNLASGFCDTKIPFNICRALAGIGVAASLPNGIAILGRAYGSSHARAVVFSIIGALAPAGFVLGGVIGGFWTEQVDTRWIWWFTAILCAAIGLVGLYIIPHSRPAAHQPSLDYIGALLLILALGFFNFSWNQGPVVGWPVSYVWALLIVSAVFGVGFYFWEKRMGDRALIPTQVLGKNNLLVYLCLWLGWMSFGLYALYLVLFLRNIRGFDNTLILAAQISPSFPAGVIAALFCPYAVRTFPGHWIFLVSMLSFMGGNLMAALTPTDLTYWAVSFPSLIVIAAGPDLSYTTGQLIVTNSVGAEYHGIAAGGVVMMTYYSQSIGLGMAATVERYVSGGDTLKGYRAVFWFGTGLAGLAVVIVGFFVRIKKQPRLDE